MDRSILSEDGFVLVSKREVQDEDAISVNSDRSSLCLVEDPANDPLLTEDSEDDERTETDGLSSGDAPKQEKAVLDSDTSETENLMETSEKLEDKAQKEERNAPEVVRPSNEPKYGCKNCRVDIAASGDIVWEGYMGANVPAVLFKSVKNTEPSSETRQQQLSTGVFLVQDVKCRNCSARLGWTYLKSFTAGQEYKVGTTIVQRSSMCKGK